MNAKKFKAIQIYMLIVWAVFLIAATIAPAADSVTLAWTANEPNPDGYRIYRRLLNEAYNYSNHGAQVGANVTTYIFDDLVEGQTYAFVVRAFRGTDESGDSNEVIYTATGPPQIVMPGPVIGIRILLD